MKVWKRFKQTYIGDRQFYSYVIALALPMIFQNLITNFVSMLDNVMVGQVGTAQMSAVSIVNQFMFVFNITVFGAVSGASIFGTQFYGKKDAKGQQYTVRFRLISSALLILCGALMFWFFGGTLISLFLAKDDDPALIEATLKYGVQYLRIMIIGLIPFGFGQAYSSVVRECGETKIPMIGSLAAIGINLVLDYGLIFGKLGMPCMGVKGAAIATVIAKIVEALVVILWTHLNPAKNPYIVGIYKSFYMPADLTKSIVIKGCPLLLNEFLWSFGMAFVAQIYSVRGIDVVAARNIAQTLTNLFNVVFVQLGGCIGIIVGAKLGANRLEEAVDWSKKLVFFSLIATVVTGLMAIPLAFVFPQIYETEDVIKLMARDFILIQATAMPIWSYTNATYFTLRSGGKTGITFLFDFGFTWIVMIPLAYVLTHFTKLDILSVIAIVTYSELLKAVVGYFLMKSGIWVNNMVNEE